jgi:hypothetical protein
MNILMRQTFKTLKNPLHCKNYKRFSRPSREDTNQTLPGRE